MEFVPLTNYTRILQFSFCSYRHHGVVLTMFALNIHVLSFGHHQTTEVTGQQCWWWWIFFTTITASGVYQMQAVDGGCRWNAGGGNECSRNNLFPKSDISTYKLTQRPKIKWILHSKSFIYVSRWDHADHWPSLAGCQEYPPWTLIWHLLNHSPMLKNILLDIISVHPRLNIQHLSSSTQGYPPHYPSRIFSSIFTQKILLNTHKEYPRLSLLLLQPLPRGSQECPLQNQCLPACPRKCSPP